METLFEKDFGIEFIEDSEGSGEAFASVSRNPAFTWAKFILTDDKPNLNLQRIPQEEFGNLITSGINAPIKMTAEKIRDHPESFPIGTITNLVQEGDKILGLAA